jgi:hypothetical protein
MPLNENHFHHSNLTEKEQREAEKAVYGLTERTPMTPEVPTYEERVKMRRWLDAMDQKEAAGGMKEFDLNKPPQVPYVYREFPYLMYHHADHRTRPARNHEERQQMLAEGWSEKGFQAEQPEIPLTAEEHAEAEKINEELKKKKK